MKGSGRVVDLEQFYPRSIPMGRALACLAIVVSLSACKDDPVGPVMQQVEFPELDPTTEQVFCIRGEIAPTMTVSGTISFIRSCPRLEAWRVRVSRTTTVEFLVSSTFNSALGLFHIPDIDAYEPSPIAEDDNGGLNRDARIEHVLDPGTEYAIVVVGSNAEDLGSYTLDVTALD
jgi:hypothetical protein